MILKALYDYYYRRRDILPAYGREYKSIAFLLVIDENGNFLRFEDRRIDKNEAASFLVKKHVGRSSAPVANYLYDNSSYVFGYSDKGDLEYNKKYLDVFKAKVEEIYKQSPNNKDIRAIHLFYEQSQEQILHQLQQSPLWQDVCKNLSKKFSTFSFLIDGDTKIIAEKEELLNLLPEECEDDEHICLVSGASGPLVETTTATMIPGSQATAKLVAFQVNSGYDSYGKNKGYNAPISKKSEFYYTTALNQMLQRDSRNKFMVGDRTFVFWSSSNDDGAKQVEAGIFTLFGFNGTEDNPNDNIDQVRKVFKSIYSGTLHTSLDDRFYILGLAPNAARVAVVYWAELPLREFAGLILKHFDDMEIVDTRKERYPYMGLRSILSAVTQGGKSSDATPNLPDALVKSIFQGLPYPYTLFAGCIRRIRAEQTFGITRAAIIKAYLNRLKDNNKKIEVMLDKENANQGYLCGRLFAVIDKIQADANNIHSIKERYMNAASATPATVFATILNLSSHHSDNLNEGSKVFYEKLKQEIIAKMSSDGFPAHLDLQDQGRFFVGYYQQMQDFFIPKSPKE